MKTIRVAFGLSILAAMFGSTALAQQRTFVSGLGNDANPCSRVAPCRTFAQAISQTNPGGEVVVLDSAGYGPVLITKAVSLISPPGVYAGISVFSGDGITISAGLSDVVSLRGLTVNNQGSAGNGIIFNTGGTLHVEGCAVNGFSSSDGINFSGPGKLELRDSTITGNGVGVFVAGAAAIAVIDQVRFERNSNGALTAREGSQVAVRDSLASVNQNGFVAFSSTSASVQLNIERCLASNNPGSGIAAQSFSTGPVQVNVESCVLYGNGAGISATSNSTGVATVRVSNSTATNNMTGLLNFGPPAVLLSRGNNTVEGNTTNTSGTIGSYSPM